MKSILKSPTPWTGLPPEFSPTDLEGFVYLITNRLTGRKYIGRKYFWKGPPRRKKRKESDWRIYKSSCDPLLSDIVKFGLENFSFEVLAVYKTRREVNYNEVREQFSRDVLYTKLNSDYLYYNTNIMSRWFRNVKE